MKILSISPTRLTAGEGLESSLLVSFPAANTALPWMLAHPLNRCEPCRRQEAAPSRPPDPPCGLCALSLPAGMRLGLGQILCWCFQQWHSGLGRSAFAGHEG